MRRKVVRKRIALGRSADLTNTRYGRLVALVPIARNRWNKVVWLCRCDCGKTTKVAGHSLTSGNTRSCGCYHKDQTSAANSKSPHKYTIREWLCYMQVTNGTVVISADDLGKVIGYRWCINSHGYATSRVGSMHRLIMAPIPPRLEVDHIDGNRLNNARENLRVVTLRDNRRYRTVTKALSGYKGVTRNGKSGWRAKIHSMGVTHCLGTYETPKAAALAYNKAAVRLFGEAACLNKID